jgi:hypothetical protein
LAGSPREVLHCQAHCQASRLVRRCARKQQATMRASRPSSRRHRSAHRFSRHCLQSHSPFRRHLHSRQLQLQYHPLLEPLELMASVHPRESGSVRVSVVYHRRRRWLWGQEQVVVVQALVAVLVPLRNRLVHLSPAQDRVGSLRSVGVLRLASGCVPKQPVSVSAPAQRTRSVRPS